MTATEKIKQARARLILNQVFFGSAALGLQLKEDEHCSTAYTDGVALGYNPLWIETLPLPKIEFLVCHEVLHCVLLHPLRIRGLNHKKANIAADYVINGILKRAGLDMPEGGLYDDKLSAADMTLEKVYRLLPDDNNGDGSGDAQDANQGDGNKKSGLADNSDITGEVREPQSGEKPMTNSDREQLETKWKIETQKAIQAAQTAGKLSGDFARMIEAAQATKRDIEDCLRDFIQRTIDNDYTWSKPNRNLIIHDLYAPRLSGEKIPDIVMVLDTSGSINDKQLGYFAAKLNNVLTEYSTIVHVIYCDTKAYCGEAYEPQDLPIKLKPKGYGGTDFRPAFKAVKDMDIDPACLIYLTDGYCDDFPSEPDYPVLWALYGEPRKMPFGDVVDINPDM